MDSNVLTYKCCCCCCCSCCCDELYAVLHGIFYGSYHQHLCGDSVLCCSMFVMHLACEGRTFKMEKWNIVNAAAARAVARLTWFIVELSWHHCLTEALHWPKCLLLYASNVSHHNCPLLHNLLLFADQWEFLDFTTSPDGDQNNSNPWALFSKLHVFWQKDAAGSHLSITC